MVEQSAGGSAAEPTAADGGWQLLPPRAVGAGRGVAWIGEGVGLFKRNALMWILALVVFVLINFAVSLLGIVPVVGSIASLLVQTVVTAGIFAICAHAEEHGDVDINQLLAGFRRNTGALVALGAMLLVLMLAVMLPIIIAAVLGMGLQGLDPDTVEMRLMEMNAQMLLVTLVALALLIPVMMAYWFAPALVFFHGIGVIAALKASFAGCLKNVVPFLLWGIVGWVLLVIGMIPLGLGLLVVGPVLMISWYAAYKDIFLHQPLGT